VFMLLLLLLFWLCCCFVISCFCCVVLMLCCFCIVVAVLLLLLLLLVVVVFVVLLLFLFFLLHLLVLLPPSLFKPRPTWVSAYLQIWVAKIHSCGNKRVFILLIWIQIFSVGWREYRELFDAIQQHQNVFCIVVMQN